MLRVPSSAVLPVLLFACLAAAPAQAQDLITSKVHAAVFGKEQAFWPQLAPAAAKAKGSKAKKSAKGDGKAAAKDTSLHLVILPLRIKEADWKESIPCDSCHRLSANGLEFFLENYLAERVTQRFPGHTVELAAPHLPLLETAKVNLLDYQDSLDLPWSKWFDGYAQDLVYRPKEWMAPASAKQRLDKLGGLLGATHLIFPAKVKVSLEPKARNVHTGNMEWGFHLLCWNVRAGKVEWAMAFTETARNVDLDAALDPRLDKALVAAWDNMPAGLADLWKSEPR